jgi:hypothetical protein
MRSPTTPMTDPTSSKSFVERYREVSRAVLDLQSALQSALASILPLETSSRGIALRLSLPKMLGWKAQRVVTAPDVPTILSALPGERAMASLIEAIEREAPSAGSIEAIRKADSALRMLFGEMDASSQEILTIAAGGLDSKAQQRNLDRMLRTQFEATVAIRGEVAASQVSTWFVMPSKGNPSMANLVSLSHMHGLRSIRPRGPHIVFRGASSAAGVATGDYSSIEIATPATLADLTEDRIVPAASSPRLDQCGLVCKSTPQGRFVVADPDQHPDGVLTLGFASVREEIGSLYRSPTDRTGEVAAQIATPTRHFCLNVMFDKSMPAVDPAAALYFAPAFGIEYGEHAELRRFTGEIDAGFVRSTAMPKSSGVDPEKHLALLEHGVRLVDRSLGDFRCYRMQIAYPPTFTRAVVRWLLPERARG